ncbi:MAG: hypothetical protein ABXS93_06210 [Sulfurimonas sp.]
MLIITSFLLSVSGCGYKAPPYYEEDAPQGDKYIQFHNKEKNFDNNESCE